VTLESLACGTPVVAYDIPAIRHNFGKCEAVLRCQPKDFQNMADKTVLILKNETLRSELKNKAREYSQRYTWSNVAKAEKEAYLKVVNTFKMPHCFFQNGFSQKGKKQASPFKESDVDRMNPGS
jgi:glycosyltransferase involved in cell wall biosynthesis